MRTKKQPRFIVVYGKRFPDWDKKTAPRVVDSAKRSEYVKDDPGETVAFAAQFVPHPGIYDAKADRICQIIADALNEREEEL